MSPICPTLPATTGEYEISVAEMLHIAAHYRAGYSAADVLLVAVDRLSPLVDGRPIEVARCLLDLHLFRLQAAGQPFGLDLAAGMESHDKIVRLLVVEQRVLLVACALGHFAAGKDGDIRHPHFAVLLGRAIAAEGFQQGQGEGAARLARVGEFVGARGGDEHPPFALREDRCGFRWQWRFGECSTHSFRRVQPARVTTVQEQE